MRTVRVAIIQGGPSSEAGVSRVSAGAVSNALKEAGYTAIDLLELTPELSEVIRRGSYDVVFPMVHGAVGEDGSLQGLLEVLDLPYVGSGVLASALAMDKPFAKKLFAEAGLPIARGIALPQGNALDAARRAQAEVGGALVVKPARNGSAIGVARLGADASLQAVADAISDVWKIDTVALVEHFARGREVTCGVLQLTPDGAPQALPPTEILAPNDAFYTYQARYTPGRSVHHCPPQMPAALIVRVQEIAVAAHHALGCRDLSRVDFVVGDAGDDSRVTLLEVNTLPGFTSTSLMPEAAAVSGIPFSELCSRLVQVALTRGRPRRNAPLSFPGGG